MVPSALTTELLFWDTRSLQDAPMMEWHGFHSHSKGNFSLTTSNYSMFVFPLRERIVFPGNSWPHCLSYVVPDTARYKSLAGGGDMRNSPFPQKRGVCMAALPTSFLRCERAGFSGADSSCGQETTKNVAKTPTWEAKEKKSPSLGWHCVSIKILSMEVPCRQTFSYQLILKLHC